MREFLLAVMNGLTVASLYFIAASGFALIFGFLRVVNLAHGAMLLLGAYLGYAAATATGSILVGTAVAFVAVAILGAAVEVLILRRASGDIFREALMTIGVATILANLMLTIWGGHTYQIEPPLWLDGATNLPIVGRYSTLRLAAVVLAVLVGLAMWWALSFTRLGAVIRAGVDDHDMLGAMGFNVRVMQTLVFGFGAGIVAAAGVVSATVLSISPGEDARYLLVSLVVVIVGGIGTIAGTALGSLLVGLAEQLGMTYSPTYATTYTFILLVLALAVRPQGLISRGVE